MAENILKLLKQAIEDKEKLEQTFKEWEDKIRGLNDQILMKEGEIKAYKVAVKTLGISENIEDIELESNLSKDNENEATKKKPRAQRATKEDMKQRYHAVGRIFLERGDITVKDLEPLLNDALGYELEPHRQRGILYRYPKIFESKEEHGIWGLTGEGRIYFESLYPDEETE